MAKRPIKHELRNPLMPITSSLSLLKHASPGGAETNKAMDVIARQLGHLSHLVNDLLFDRHLAKPPSVEVLRDLLAHGPGEACDAESITAPMTIEPGE
jgi:signal transduction histidine kinase